MKPYLLLLSVSILASCSPRKQAETKIDNSILTYSTRAVLPHDTKAFTEGLIIHNGKVFESTGGENSWIAEVDVESGIQNKKVQLDKSYFGEGITILNNKIYQLTWKNKIGFVYDLATYTKIDEFSYEREGWGITHNNHELIVSDGTETLYFLDTAEFSITRKLVVKENGIKTTNLNELEYIEEYIFANQWETNYILKIDPEDGTVVGKFDLSEFTKKAKWMYPQSDVLNGIAYNSKTKDILVTGKYWPLSFIIRLN
ncbi:MAG: glutaminyl-peptide cyclotransferase [Bacteroidia bacterium]|nr:glutaminyl-peptide cyclotransferase [Bacteroidia bacterium]